MADKFNDFASAARHLEKKGLEAALKDGSVKPILNLADKLDIQRKGLVEALAQLCANAEGRGIPAKTIIECLKGAVEGMERASGG